MSLDASVALTYGEVARAETPRGELVLRERRTPTGRGCAIELRANGVFVMDTVEVGTERALARAMLDLVADPARVMVGGLGLGFTMHEVLADPRVQECVVVEIEQALVDWLRDGTVPHGPGMLADARLGIVVADLAGAVAEARDASYDLVLIDVDNGPGYLVHDANAGLYDAPFLTAVRRALRPGGAVGVWSAAAAPDLEHTLREVFGEAEARPLAVRLQDRDEEYWLYAARTPASEPTPGGAETGAARS